MNTIFAILLAGCGHDAGPCTALDEVEFMAPDRTTCEAELDRRMAFLGNGWPVHRGICIVRDPHATETPPAWWPVSQARIASR